MCALSPQQQTSKFSSLTSKAWSCQGLRQLSRVWAGLGTSRMLPRKLVTCHGEWRVRAGSVVTRARSFTWFTHSYCSPVTLWCNQAIVFKSLEIEIKHFIFISEHLCNDCVAFNAPLLIAFDQFLFVKTDLQFGRRDIENCFRGSGDHYREEIFTVIFINLTKEEALQQCYFWWLDDFWLSSSFQNFRIENNNLIVHLWQKLKCFSWFRQRLCLDVQPGNFLKFWQYIWIGKKVGFCNTTKRRGTGEMSNLSIFIMLKLLISFVFCCPMSLQLNGIVSIHKEKIKIIFIFSCEEAALEGQRWLCLCVINLKLNFHLLNVNL